LVISADGREGSAQIAQNASIYRVLAEAHSSILHELTAGRGIWLHVIRGTAILGNNTLSPGDAASLEEPGTVEIQAGPDGLEALLFDLG
jgi:redox-sensitive bicupin YhaK (pirin superfamily)